MLPAPHDDVMARLVEAARRARQRAYAPYSGYRVGAAIATKSGKVFVGCNVENASYGACLCAERNAIAQMVAAGELHPVACAVVTEGPRPGSPCGICRQVLAEFARDMPVALVAEGASANRRRDTTLAALLPDAFRLGGRRAKPDADGSSLEPTRGGAAPRLAGRAPPSKARRRG